MKHLLTSLLLLATTGCASVPEYESSVGTMERTDVLLVSDHTLPGHLNLSSGGANGEERIFIDPTIASLKKKLEALNLSVYVLNVEDMIEDRDIQEKATFDLAYKRYDNVLKAAVEANTTILSIHYDANIIPSKVNIGENDYIGGAHVILDQRSASEASVAFANSLIFEGQVLEQLNPLGLRIRPNYDDEIRYQKNLTMNIIGNSQGGAALLEIGAQEQAQALFGDTPEEVVNAIEKPLAMLANTIKKFRQARELSN